jgi:hypothetical protein
MMQYTNYEKAVVQRYGIELQGWTYEKLVNPSELSTAVQPLQKLLEAIKAGDCKFVKLTPDERRMHLETYKKKIAKEEIKVRERKTRSDAGTRKRKRMAIDHGDENSGGDQSDEEDREDVHKSPNAHRRLPKQRAAGRSASIIDDSDSD